MRVRTWRKLVDDLNTGVVPPSDDADRGSDLAELAGPVRELYAGPPESFIDRRKELVASLRKERRRAEATAAGKLRRPTVAAWALDRLAADAPDELRELVDLGGRLQSVQSGSTA